MSGPPITVERVSIDAPAIGAILDDVSFTVRPGELIAIVGPSGGGKTTLLRCVAGLARPSRGSVTIGAARVTGTPDNLAVVFQSYERSLFPWLSVGRNVELPLEARGLPRAERMERVHSALQEVGLVDRAAAHPRGLSGGEQQRVAIARAIASRAGVVLMDEPFGSIDSLTRLELQDMTTAVWERHRSTILFVTHDVDEAVYLADRVLVLSPRPGRIVGIVDVTMPRPRSQDATRASADFLRARAEVASVLHAAGRR